MNTIISTYFEYEYVFMRYPVMHGHGDPGNSRGDKVHTPTPLLTCAWQMTTSATRNRTRLLTQRPRGICCMTDVSCLRNPRPFVFRRTCWVSPQAPHQGGRNDYFPLHRCCCAAHARDWHIQFGLALAPGSWKTGAQHGFQSPNTPQSQSALMAQTTTYAIGLGS